MPFLGDQVRRRDIGCHARQQRSADWVDTLERYPVPYKMAAKCWSAARAIFLHEIQIFLCETKIVEYFGGSCITQIHKSRCHKTRCTIVIGSGKLDPNGISNFIYLIFNTLNFNGIKYLPAQKSWQKSRNFQFETENTHSQDTVPLWRSGCCHSERWLPAPPGAGSGITPQQCSRLRLNSWGLGIAPPVCVLV